MKNILDMSEDERMLLVQSLLAQTDLDPRDERSVTAALNAMQTSSPVALLRQRENLPPLDSLESAVTSSGGSRMASAPSPTPSSFNGIVGGQPVGDEGAFMNTPYSPEGEDDSSYWWIPALLGALGGAHLIRRGMRGGSGPIRPEDTNPDPRVAQVKLLTYHGNERRRTPQTIQDIVADSVDAPPASVVDQEPTIASQPVAGGFGADEEGFFPVVEGAMGADGLPIRSSDQMLDTMIDGPPAPTPAPAPTAPTRTVIENDGPPGESVRARNRRQNEDALRIVRRQRELREANADSVIDDVITRNDSPENVPDIPATQAAREEIATTTSAPAPKKSKTGRAPTGYTKNKPGTAEELVANTDANTDAVRSFASETAAGMREDRTNVASRMSNEVDAPYTVTRRTHNPDGGRRTIPSDIDSNPLGKQKAQRLADEREFETSATMRALMRQHPDATVEDMIRKYMSNPTQTVYLREGGLNGPVAIEFDARTGNVLRIDGRPPRQATNISSLPSTSLKRPPSDTALPHIAALRTYKNLVKGESVGAQ